MKFTIIKILKRILASISPKFFTNITNVQSENLSKPLLKFNASGKFKIVQFADIHNGPDTDQRTSTLMNKILDYENPDMVILMGDNIDSKCKSIEDVKQAITNIAQPMEIRKIPWAIVFGNHDDEHGVMTKEEMMNLYMSFSNNVSQIGYKTYNRIGNYNLLIQGSNNTPIFNIYFLDSGAYAPVSIGGYDYIESTQIKWYKNTAYKLKLKYGKKIPSLMFFHIPLPEFYEAWSSGLINGERLEPESSPKTNSGLFNALVKIGDVKGVFVGHDHLNNYYSSLNEIKLGYGGNVGYATYGKDGVAKGARIFLINESDSSNFKTWIRQEGDAELDNTSV